MSETGLVCHGCGSPLQSEHPERPGYIPEHVRERSDNGNLRCRRCYRIEQYGIRQVDREPRVAVAELPMDPTMAVNRALSRADLAVMVVDLWDFEGSFAPELVAELDTPLIVAVNKIDLLPARTPPTEVLTWVEGRFADQGIPVEEVRLISAERGTGVKALMSRVQSRLPEGGSVALVGVTNVGKSALVRRLLPRGAAKPTTSTLPGTTQDVLKYTLAGGITLLDTPGIIPGHRLADSLCPQCAAALVPKKRLKSKLVQLGAGKAIIFGGLAAVQRNGTEPGDVVTLAYTSERVAIHPTRASRALELLQAGEDSFLHMHCATCGQRLMKGGWEDARFTVQEGEDLVIPGLGWISPRNAPLDVTVTLPTGSLVILRPRLIGPKGSPRPRKKSGRVRAK